MATRLRRELRPPIHHDRDWHIDYVLATTNDEKALSVGPNGVVDGSELFLQLKQCPGHSDYQSRTQLNTGSHERSIRTDEEQFSTRRATMGVL